MTKQGRIEELEKELSEAFNEISRLKNEIKGYKRMESLAEHRIETEYRDNLQLKESIRKIRDDNIALCAEHGADYWEGITDVAQWGDKDTDKQLIVLKAKLKAKELIIEHLKDVLCGRNPNAPKKKTPGRKPISETQKKRIRKYRKDGYTLKEIISMEGVSLGSASNICKGLKKQKPE